MNIVIDTNIFIEAIIKNGAIRKLLTTLKHILLFPEFEFIEIKNHFPEIIIKSKMSEEECRNIISSILKYIKIVKTADIIQWKEKAGEIMEHIDKDDVIFIATALAKNALIWSDDKHFKMQNTIEVYTTREIINIQ